MTRYGEESSESAIVRVDGGPNHPDRPGESGLFERFRHFIRPWLRKGSDLSEAYAEAKVAKEQNEARKTVEEAAEIAARCDVERQRAVKEFNANVDDIFADDGLPEAGKALKLAKLIAANPDLAQQWGKVRTILDSLHLTKGVSIQAVTEELVPIALPHEPDVPPAELARAIPWDKLSVRTQRVLQQLGVTSLNELVDLTEKELLARPGIGKTSLAELRRILSQQHLALRK